MLRHILPRVSVARLGSGMVHIVPVVLRAARARPALASALIAWLAFVAVHQIAGISRFQWDSQHYWSLARRIANGTFPDSLRGYCFPALLAPFRRMFDFSPGAGLLAYRWGTSALYAFGTCVLVPAVFADLGGRSIPVHRRLVVPGLVLLLFPGLVLYPLSDLPALLLMTGSVWCALRVRTAAPLRGLGLAALSGVLAYGTYNCRTIYQFSFLLTGLGAAAMPASGTRLRVRSGLAAAFLAGAALASLPQARLNLTHVDAPLPIVRTNVYDGRSLFIRQLLWGVTMQKYETSIEPNSPAPGLRYMDAAGKRFFDANKFDFGTTTVGQYLAAMARDPLFFVGLLGRHFMNGLDVRDGDVYLTSPSIERHALSVFNLLVVSAGFLALATHAGPGGCLRTPAACFWLFVLVLPVFVALPGAVETRFFLPLHVLLYASIAYATPGHEFLSHARRWWPVYAVGCAVTAGMFYGITFTTMSSLEYFPESKYSPID